MPLKPIDLMPVLSWLFLKGRCRTCRVKISGRYPLVETITGLAFWWSSVAANGDVTVFIRNVLLLSGLIIIFFVDIDYEIIPDKIIFTLAPAGLIFAIIKHTWVDSLLAAAVGFSLFFLIAVLGKFLFKKDAMGGGDIKLAGLLGLYMGMSLTLTGLFLAFLVGSIVSIPILMFRSKRAEDHIPFGPMMALGAVIALVKGQAILDWYGNWVSGLWF